MRRQSGLTLIELLAAMVIGGILIFVATAVVPEAYRRSALAVAANNIRSLAVGGQQYLADHNHHYWLTVKDRATFADSEGQVVRGAQWWYGFETQASQSAGEGHRTFDSSRSPLADYIPAALRPDPSFASGGRAFKPKYKSGYIGIGYNAVLGGGRGATSDKQTLSYWSLAKPSEVAVFATCAQVNTFQSPASAAHPMIEEFPYFDQKETTLHAIARGNVLVGFADGSAGMLPLDKVTIDSRDPHGSIGRFAPAGSYLHLR
jgi:prepilin-type N-terminal cleavage/methylation domain-containing protein